MKKFVITHRQIAGSGFVLNDTDGRFVWYDKEDLLTHLRRELWYFFWRMR